MNSPTPTETAVWNALRSVVDPELGCNIVDLGLVYDVAIEGARVRVRMTLTTPGCPMHESLCTGAQLALFNLEGVQEAQVELVWDPPWHPAMMSETARALLAASRPR
ncbi:MAG: metal-sulfur cluster assembly factor [Verrucomicrobiae bacterium]|nr:metal-sulfur cluster assembly factor [Verrucomicrobiae bacterium]